MTKPLIRKIAEATLKSLFERHGLKHRKSGIYTIELGNDFLGWIGVANAVKDGVIAVNPNIGLRHQPTHELLCKFLSEKIHPYTPVTVSKSVGFLLPEQKWKEWYFDVDSDGSYYRTLVDLWIEVAMPFMRRNANLKSLETMLEGYDYVALKIYQRERYPIVKLLNGDPDGAIAKAKEYAESMKEDVNSRSLEYYQTVYLPNLIRYAETGRID